METVRFLAHELCFVYLILRGFHLALVDEVRGIAHTSQFNITQATPVTCNQIIQ